MLEIAGMNTQDFYWLVVAWPLTGALAVAVIWYARRTR